ncbi:substrate-binding domain-containing protein [Vibrio cholerae]|uniref:substrate-binding domain-containing protein n=1 Tax=Vibrio cholerae TaxID=666 RepID=UPI003D7EAE76
MKKLLLVSAMFVSLSASAEISLFGPGGPHVPLLEVAKNYQTITGKEVKVYFGPQATWNEEAKAKADILFGASEQSALAIANDHADKFDIHQIQPVYLREAVILVKPGNPKKITGIQDLISKDVGIVVNDGHGQSNTSGTGVWEDIVGRLANIESVSKFRDHIVLFAPNSGSARKTFLEDEKVDAWITWKDWAIANPQLGEMVEIEPELKVYRDFNIVLKNHASADEEAFFQFLKSDSAYQVFKKYGWFK